MSKLISLIKICFQMFCVLYIAMNIDNSSPEVTVPEFWDTSIELKQYILVYFFVFSKHLYCHSILYFYFCQYFERKSLYFILIQIWVTSCNQYKHYWWNIDNFRSIYNKFSIIYLCNWYLKKLYSVNQYSGTFFWIADS